MSEVNLIVPSYSLDRKYSICTAVVSLSCFTILVVSWIAAWFCTLVSLKTIEYSLTGQWRDSIYLSNLLSMLSPFMTLCAMASPLVQVTRAVRIGSPDHGLQTRLIGAFLSCGLLGVAYGWRVGLKSVLISNSFSILLQCTSLAGIYYLWPLRQSNILAVLFKWLIFVALLLTYGLGVYYLSMKLPLHTALTPLFTISCILPYCATFSTFPRDLNAFRTWYARPDRSSSTGPKGVDLFTLSVMQINNSLWLSYGTLIRDPAIFISSIVGLCAAAIQLNSYFMPLVFVTLQTTWFGDVTKISRFHIDVAWPFTHGKMPSRRYGEETPSESSPVGASDLIETPKMTYEMVGVGETTR